MFWHLCKKETRVQRIFDFHVRLLFDLQFAVELYLNTYKAVKTPPSNSIFFIKGSEANCETNKSVTRF